MGDEIHDVIVIGAGAAGLAAAADLLAAGKSLVLLEARDRVGGRVHTVHDPAWPIPIERGAEFIHGRPRETWDLLSAAALSAYDVADTHRRLLDGRLENMDDFWSRINLVMQRIEQRNGADRTLAQFLADNPDLPPDAAEMATLFVEGFDAADKNQVGIEWISRSNRAQERLGNEMFRVTGGYGGMMSWLASQLGSGVSMQLNTAVRELQWSRNNVTAVTQGAVELGGKSFRARAAIITLPLGVLQAPPDAPGAVRFVPVLPDKDQPLQRLRMGPVTKMLLRFSERFWEQAIDPDVSFIHAPGELLPTWWTPLPVRAPVLTAWAGGPAAEELARRPPDEVLDLAMEALAKMTHTPRNRLQPMLRAWNICDWQKDPYSRGAYSYGGVNSAGDAEQLARPIEQTLFFAGEATYNGMSGTVSGALASGRRAAAEVLASQG